MVRYEVDREELLRDATALVERVELAPRDAGSGDHVVLGFRADGALSVYFGSDPAYHFNSHGELRRAFCGGQLFKAERGRLVAMRRVRGEQEVQLRSRPLDDEEQTALLAALLERLRGLMRQCRENALIAVGQVPADADVFDHAMDWLSDWEAVSVAQSPRAR